MKHKLQKVDIDQLQDQRKKKKKSKTNSPHPPIETKNKFKMEIEMDSTPAINKSGQLKQKAQGPHWPGWKSTYKHRSDQWKTRRHI